MPYTLAGFGCGACCALTLLCHGGVARAQTAPDPCAVLREPLAAVSPTSVDRDEVMRIEERIRAEVASGFSGEVLVARDSRLLVNGAYGALGGHAVLAQQHFLMASAAKQFTSAAVLRLVDQGKVALDDPITKVFANVPRDKQTITVRQLLAHTSGLAQGYGSEAAADGPQAAAMILAEPLTERPGVKFQYSNENYQLAAAIVEVISGERYDDFLERELFAPAGLHDTGRVRRPERALDLAPTLAPLPARLLDSQWGGYGYYTTAADFYRWFLELRAGCIVSRAAVAEIFKPEIAIKEGSAGLGWFLGKTSGGQDTIFTRGNDDFGQNGLLYWYPRTATTIVILTHAGQKNDQLSYSRSLLRELESLLVTGNGT
jgi:CubicO group peptidase (beta-lactamase class C family)